MNLRLVALVAAGLLLGNQAHASNCGVNAGPIWNQQDANAKCPGVCNNNGYGPWTGGWWTTQPGVMSVCECGPIQTAVDAGPIWNQQDANAKCPPVCTKVNGSWSSGQWWTTQPGVMSVCQCAVCTLPPAPAAPAAKPK